MRFFWLLCVLAAQRAPAECPHGMLTPAQARIRYQELQEQADKLFQAGEFAKAADQLRAGLCFAPGNFRAYQALGLAEAATGRFERAEQALEQASRLAPRDFTVKLARAQVQVSLGNFDAARRILLEAAALEPGEAGAAMTHAQLARQLLQQKQYDLALAEFLRFRQAGGIDPEALLLLARLENTLGAYHDAVRDASTLEKRRDLTARLRAQAAAIAGLSYKNLERADEAIPHLKLAMELTLAEPGAVFETACLALAEIYEGKQDPTAAKAVLASAGQVLPDSVRIAIALGRNLAEAGDRAAIALLRTIIESFPQQAEAYKWLAQAHTAAGEFQLATRTLEQLASRRPDYPMIDVMIAQSILKENEPDNARALGRLAHAEKISPSDPDIYYLRGKIFAALGNYQQAVEAFRRAIALAPTAANSYYQLGLAYQKLGQPGLAKEQFDRMAELRTFTAPE